MPLPNKSAEDVGAELLKKHSARLHEMAGDICAPTDWDTPELTAVREKVVSAMREAADLLWDRAKALQR